MQVTISLAKISFCYKLILIDKYHLMMILLFELTQNIDPLVRKLSVVNDKAFTSLWCLAVLIESVAAH